MRSQILEEVLKTLCCIVVVVFVAAAAAAVIIIEITHCITIIPKWIIIVNNIDKIIEQNGIPIKLSCF